MLTTPTRVPRRLASDLAVYGLSALAAAALLIIASRRPSLARSSYVAGSNGRFVLSLFTAVALVAVAFLVAERPTRAAPAFLVTGLLWTIPEWSGWRGAGALATFLAQASSVLLPAAAFWATLIAAQQQPRRWRLIAAAVALAGAAAALAWDSFAEPGCWRACQPPTVALAGDGHWLLRAVLAASIAAAVTVAVAVCVERPGLDDRILASFAGVCLVAGLAAQVLPPAAVVDTADGPPRLWAFALSQAVALALALSIGWRHWQAWSAIARLNRLTAELQELGTPVHLQEALRCAVRDPALDVSWWSAPRSTWLDCDGIVTPRPRTTEVIGGQRIITMLTRDGIPLAAVTHLAALPADRLRTSLRPAVTLSLDNARLQAATRAELAAARATALRLVERSDAERRLLQRNLHDGVQQRLVGLALAVRLLRVEVADQAEDAESPDPATVWDRADALVMETLVRIRRIAHGVHPPLLADAGLSAALQELADLSTDVVVRVVELTAAAPVRDQAAAAVEAAAYAAAESALDDAAGRRARQLEIRLRHDDHGTLHVLMLDDGEPDGTAATAPTTQHLAAVQDRVRALDGHLRIEHRRATLRPRSMDVT